MRNEAVIDSGKFQRNIEEIRRFLPETCRVMAVLKGDAYGHGIKQIAPLAQKNPFIAMAGVSSLDEAQYLCRLGIQKPVLVLGQTSWAQLMEEPVPPLVIFSASSPEDVRMYLEAGKQLGKRLPIHLRLDFGGGVRGMDRRTFVRSQEWLLTAPGVCGLYTHVYSAYMDDEERMARDFLEFDDILQSIPLQLRRRLVCHTLTSVSFYRFPAYTYDMIRAGAALYGFPLPGQHAPGLSPVLSIRASVLNVVPVTVDSSLDYWHDIPSHVRSVAQLSIGNWDIPGFFRGKRIHVRIGHHLLEVVGSPCMDTCCVDVTCAPDVRSGDTAYFLQDQPGVRLTDKIRENGFGYADCQMMFSGTQRLKRVVC